MVLEHIQTRFIAGFTTISMVLFGVLMFQIKVLKNKLQAEQHLTKYYKQQVHFYKQQLELLQQENEQLVKELNSIKDRLRNIEQTRQKIQKNKKQYIRIRKKINDVTVNKKGPTNEREIIRLINSFFNCSE